MYIKCKLISIERKSPSLVFWSPPCLFLLWYSVTRKRNLHECSIDRGSVLLRTNRTTYNVVCIGYTATCVRLACTVRTATPIHTQTQPMAAQVDQNIIAAQWICSFVQNKLFYFARTFVYCVHIEWQYMTKGHTWNLESLISTTLKVL